MANDTMDDGAERRLNQFFGLIGDVLGDDQRRASFATYAMGLLSDGERKSIEPIAAKVAESAKHASAEHQRLHHFIANQAWNDRAVRRQSVRYALGELERQESIVAWILDDTGFLKQGTHSVGVQRQYTGSAGKVTNCQLGVSLSLATPARHLPVDFDLYLPRTWTDTRKRRREARIPDAIEFRTKPEIGLELVRRAVEDDLPRGIVLGDTAYGNSSIFRMALRSMGLEYALAVDSTTKCWRVDRLLRRKGDARSVKDWAKALGPKKFRRITWREGTREALSARFAFLRVVPSHDDGIDPAVREDVWLVIEWEDSESAPTKYYFVAAPSMVSNKQIIRAIKQRWRTERVYEDLKGELGLDHFEGRSYPGWHHHISAVLCCNAFLVAEQARAFPPSAREAAEAAEDE